MNDFQIFKFKDIAPVRIMDRAGNPWFVAVDVCKALEITNSRMAVERLDEDEKTTVSFTDGRAGHGAQKINIISESGLYALIIRSSKPAAKDFRKWITAEVLPAIRKTGFYAVDTAPAVSDPQDDPAKRSTADLIEYTNRRLQSGENIPPHVLQYVSNIARIASGVWYRDCFGIDGRAKRLLPGDCLLPEFSEHENQIAAKMIDLIRRNGKCTLQFISRNFSHTGIDAARRLRIIAALIECGTLQCSGEPGESGATYSL